MAKLHTHFNDGDFLNHKEYAFEIMEYLSEHPEELNLYNLLFEYGFKDSLISHKLKEFFVSGEYDVYLHEQRVADIHNTLIPLDEFPQWFVNKFPQWKDLFYY
ncbi:hypothetical protein [Methanosphaera sp. WGK6]|uniref:hypothetical protein n=1 Tax=Methanosphaera sp. WGK6 TaxID=1561964 RepID=UPI00084C5F59|nr:hypothetical protein [Methanosphaera sp. WGK6]OED30383.1 hypothetical protein NL43_03145 [Methanosphaera sp. WGK6]